MLINQAGNTVGHVISCFCLEVDEICTVLRYCAAWGGYSLPTFQDNLSLPSSSVKKSFNFLMLR